MANKFESFIANDPKKREEYEEKLEQEGKIEDPAEVKIIAGSIEIDKSVPEDMAKDIASNIKEEIFCDNESCTHTSHPPVGVRLEGVFPPGIKFYYRNEDSDALCFDQWVVIYEDPVVKGIRAENKRKGRDFGENKELKDKWIDVNGLGAYRQRRSKFRHYHSPDWKPKIPGSLGRDQ